MAFFQRGQPMIFVEKSKFSFTFFQGKMSLEIMFHDVLDKKDILLDNKITFFQKCQKRPFSKGVSPNFLLLFQGKKSIEIMFQIKRKLFLTIKRIIFQKSKNRFFPKGLTHDFCQKIPNFLLLFQGKRSIEIMFQIKRKLFLTIKRIIFQKSKNRFFPKGLTHDFCQKIPNFLLLFQGKKSIEIMFWIKRKVFGTIKIRIFQKC